LKISELKEIKIEPESDDNDQLENDDVFKDNIKKEKEVQFVLILPPRQVKIEVEEDDKVQEETQSNGKKFQCQQCPKSFDQNRSKKTSTSSQTKSEMSNLQQKNHNSSFKRSFEKTRECQKIQLRSMFSWFCNKERVDNVIMHMWTHRSEKQAH
jgi:hypothetical protein